VKILLSVALGGAVGASARYLLGSHLGTWLGHGVPWATLTINILGSFLLGVFVEVSALVWSPSAPLRAFIAVGALGGFTTFSAFSLDVVLLAERGRLETAALYALASAALAIGGLFAGLRLTRWILA
jgi:CrcB protein